MEYHPEFLANLFNPANQGCNPDGSQPAPWLFVRNLFAWNSSTLAHAMRNGAQGTSNPLLSDGIGQYGFDEDVHSCWISSRTVIDGKELCLGTGVTEEQLHSMGIEDATLEEKIKEFCTALVVEAVLPGMCSC